MGRLRHLAPDDQYLAEGEAVGADHVAGVEVVVEGPDGRVVRGAVLGGALVGAQRVAQAEELLEREVRGRRVRRRILAGPVDVALVDGQRQVLGGVRVVGVERVAHLLALQDGAVGEAKLRLRQRLTAGAAAPPVGHVDPVEDVLVGVVVRVGLRIESVPSGLRGGWGAEHRERVVALPDVAAVPLDEWIRSSPCRAG